MLFEHSIVVDSKIPPISREESHRRYYPHVPQPEAPPRTSRTLPSWIIYLLVSSFPSEVERKNEANVYTVCTSLALKSLRISPKRARCEPVNSSMSNPIINSLPSHEHLMVGPSRHRLIFLLPIYYQ